MSPMTTRCSCRWMFNSKCQHLQVSLSLSFEWQIDMTSLCVGSQQTPGRDVQRWKIQLHQRVYISSCQRFSLPQSIGFLNMIYSVEKSNLIKLFFYKISGPAPIRSSNAGKQINNIILVSRQGDKLKTKQKPNSLFQRIGRWLLQIFFLGPASRKQQRPSRVFLM